MHAHACIHIVKYLFRMNKNGPVTKATQSAVCNITRALSESATEDQFAEEWRHARPQLVRVAGPRFVTYFEGQYIIKLPHRSPPFPPSSWALFGNPTRRRTNSLEPFNAMLKDLVDAAHMSVIRAAEFFFQMLIRTEAIAQRSDAGLDVTASRARRGGQNSMGSIYRPPPKKGAHSLCRLCLFITYALVQPSLVRMPAVPPILPLRLQQAT